MGLITRVLSLIPKRVIRELGTGKPYLVRYKLIKLFGYRVYLHHILLSDSARHRHDHPWPFVTLILKGGYWEDVDSIVNRRPQWRRPGSVLFNHARHTHRVLLDLGRLAWTLVLRGRRWRQWGFHTECGWQNWKTYCDKADAGAPVCED